MSKNLNTKIRLVMVLLLTLFMATASFIGFQFVTRNAMEQDLFGNQPPCGLPCWNNITPGVTNRDEAVKILKETAYIDKGSIKESGTNEFGGCRWNWRVSGRRISPTLRWQDGVVREISLGLTFNLSIDDILKEFEAPEAVSVIEGGTPENWYWVIDMFYPHFGIQVKVYTPNFSSVIEPSTEVGAIVLFSPTSIENRLSALYPNSSSNNFNWLLKTWKGYGDIKKLYDGNEK